MTFSNKFHFIIKNLKILTIIENLIFKSGLKEIKKKRSFFVNFKKK